METENAIIINGIKYTFKKAEGGRCTKCDLQERCDAIQGGFICDPFDEVIGYIFVKA